MSLWNLMNVSNSTVQSVLEIEHLFQDVNVDMLCNFVVVTLRTLQKVKFVFEVCLTFHFLILYSS